MKLKKNTFIQGAFIATFGIVLCKILGIVYVIPFYSIIGEQGGALYGYAYNIYSIFLGISQAGIPLAISKIISEYNTLGYYSAKERAFKIGKKLLSLIGIICFLVLFIFADHIGELIIGNVTGGNTKEDVAFVIRTISTAILVIPTMSVYRGYLQGHKFITPTTLSQVMEQLSRVVIIVLGSFLMMRVFNLSLKVTVGCALFAATVGGLVALTYLYIKTKRNKEQLLTKEVNVKEPYISNKQIAKKIIIYALPFIMIDVFRSLYNSVDIMMLVKVLVNDFGFNASDAESIMSIITTWGNKINMIIIALVSGVMTSLIPNLSASYVQGDMKEVEHKINQTYKIVLFLALPMTIGLSFLAKPVWTIFYGVSTYGALTYQYLVFVALATAIFTSTVTIVQLMKEYKMVFISLISGMMFKVLFNIPLLYSFKSLGLPAFYGSITATILGFLVSAGISMLFLRKKYKISYEATVKEIINIIIAAVAMVIVLYFLRLIIPINTDNRILAVGIVALYGVVGSIIYFIITLKTKTVENIFGEKLTKKIKKIIKI